MRYLLDTHALLWYLFDDSSLSLTAKEIINNEFCYYTKLSLWEIAIKQTRKLLQYRQTISQIINACKDVKTIWWTDSIQTTDNWETFTMDGMTFRRK